MGPCRKPGRWDQRRPPAVMFLSGRVTRTRAVEEIGFSTSKPGAIASCLNLLHSDPRYFWYLLVGDGWMMVGCFFYSQFPHDFDLAGATKSASSRCRLAPSMAQTLHRLLEPLPGLENRDQKNLMKTDGQLGEKLRNVL